MFDGADWNDIMGTTYTVMAGTRVVAKTGVEENADYIATMHPGVGEALALLLDHLATDRENADVDGRTWDHGCMPLARLILRETP